MPRSNDDPRRHVQVLAEQVGAVSELGPTSTFAKLDVFLALRLSMGPSELIRADQSRSQVAGSEFPGHYPGEDHSWNLQKFKEVSRTRCPVYSVISHDCSR